MPKQGDDIEKSHKRIKKLIIRKIHATKANIRGRDKPEGVLPTHREDKYMERFLGNVQETPHRASQPFKA